MLQEQGKPTPLDEAPKFDAEEVWFIDAFNRLDKCRPPRMFGNAYIPVPLSEYVAYFSLFEPLYELDTTLDILQHIDIKVFEVVSQAIEAKAKQTKTKFAKPEKEEVPLRMGPK